jgi:hypothetical protein
MLQNSRLYKHILYIATHIYACVYVADAHIYNVHIFVYITHTFMAYHIFMYVQIFMYIQL